MAELLKLIQTTDVAFKSSLMNTFVSEQKSNNEKCKMLNNVADFSMDKVSDKRRNMENTKMICKEESDSDGTFSDSKTQSLIIQTLSTISDFVSKNEDSYCLEDELVSATKACRQPQSVVIVSEPLSCRSNIDAVQEVIQVDRSVGVSVVNQELLAEVTKAVFDAHMTTCLNLRRSVSEATARFYSISVSDNVPDIGKFSLNGEAMLEKLTKQIAPEITRVVKFCKLLPGFSDLCLADQVTLIKAGTFEVMMVRFSMLIDNDKQTMQDPTHEVLCSRDVVRAMPMGEFLDSFFNIGASFNPLHLTDDEIGLYTSIILFTPSRHSLHDAQLVTCLQSLYKEAFFGTLKQNHNDAEELFSKAMQLLPMFHDMNMKHDKTMTLQKENKSRMFDKYFPAIHREMFGVSED